ncbi:hypothetical protein OHA04_24090 [Streptomyces sp. NBC_01590]|uniref:hypothetical protein n=1 Tax=Streptomyces sp. NBC_01590 TaxID=2975887 RepID=UPI00386A0602
MLELLPGIGVVLPGEAGVLRFGTGADAAHDLLTASADGVHLGMQCGSLTIKDCSELRHAHEAWLGGYLFQPGWNTVAEFDGLRLTMAGGGPGAADGLAGVEVRRVRPASGAHAGAAAVVWDGVDLFGHPAEEVLQVLPESVRLPGPATAVAVPALGLRLGGDAPVGDRWGQLTLTGTGSDGWARCCAGRFRCAEGGDGLVGIMY